MSDLKNTRVAGKYSKGKNKYASVTTILSIIDRPALRYWFGKLVYEAVSGNPTITVADALKYPYKSLANSAKRGTEIHSLIQGSDSFLGEHSGEIAGFEKWKEDYKPQILDNEVTLFHDKYLFAGTFDLRAKIKNKIWLIDLKTGTAIYNNYALQLSAYRMLCKENNIIVNKIAVLRLEENNYEFKEFKYRPEIFLSALNLYNWSKEKGND